MVIDPRHARALRLAREARSRLARGDVDLGGIDLRRYDALAGVSPLFEKAATAGWLAADVTNFEKLKRAYDFDWSLVRQGWESDHPNEEFPFAGDEPLVFGNEPAQPDRLPKIETRARAAGLLPYMNAYKMLCMSDHSTLASASYGLDPAPRRRMRVARFGLAGAMVLSLGQRVDEAYELGRAARLAELDSRLRRLVAELSGIRV